MSRAAVLALVLAGGEGSRLRPLTAQRAKPAVHFARGYRLVDFVLGNLVNSGISPIYVLVQYKPARLIEHLNSAWRSGPQSGIAVIRPDAPGMRGSFRGTADAVHCCVHLLDRHQPDVVAVFAADHVYRMDVRQMLDFHLSHCADVTVAGIPVPMAEAGSFGIMATGADGGIRQFQEKPLLPVPMPGTPGRACASMGNYLFRPAVLVSLLERAAQRGGTDFGRHVMPELPGSGLRALAYDFTRNELPGLQPHEERAYWRDVGTLEALAQARRDVAGPRPRFDLRNRAWPIRRRRLEPFGAGRKAPGSAGRAASLTPRLP